MASPLHEGLCALLAEELGLRSRDFAPSVTAWVGPDLATIRELDALERHPDGHRIDDEGLLIVEVAVDHPPSSQLLFDYAKLWLFLDTHELDMRMLVFDRYGEGREVNLERIYYAMATQQRPGG